MRKMPDRISFMPLYPKRTVIMSHSLFLSLAARINEVLFLYCKILEKQAHQSKAPRFLGAKSGWGSDGQNVRRTEPLS